MELKTNYQYTYFVYPYAIKEKEYKKYISNLIHSKKYQIKFFDSFKDVELYKYFIPSIKSKVFQDFSFTKEKINKFERLSMSQKINILKEQSCLIFEYKIDKEMQGKTEERDGIFFGISKVELVCFNTGICFLLLKTHLLETEDFKDILNFNYKFRNIKLQQKNIESIDNIKIQTNMFNNMNNISDIISKLTGQRIINRKIDINEEIFLTYTYACIDFAYWSKQEDFSSIENEFIKLAEVKQNDININMDYDKLSLLTNSSYKKVRVTDKSVAAICSSKDKENYTKFPMEFENQYLYTYLISLHQRYYLKSINKEFGKKPKKAIKDFLQFINNSWITELTTDSFGQKLYKRCKEKNNLQEIFNDTKSKYDVYYKKLNIEKNKKTNQIIVIMLICCILLGLANLASWMFYK